jgi:hypothetical protein
MPTLSQPYFLDGTSLLDSTSVYTNSGLSIYAADGFYSDGFNIRELVGGILLPSQPCPSCGVPCGEANGSARGEGIYKMTINTGTTPFEVGVIVIRYTPFDAPSGLKAVFDGVTYNQVSSQNECLLSGVPSGLPIFLGITSSQSSCPSSSIIGGPFTLPSYVWDGTTFNPTGGTEDVTVITAQDKTTLINPNVCVMVIPKPDPSVSILEITSYGVCTQSEFNITIECPRVIKSINSSIKFTDPDNPELCSADLKNKLYPVRVTGVSPYIGLHDWIFADEFATTVVANGFYRTNNLAAPYDTIEVQNGVVVAVLDQCP